MNVADQQIVSKIRYTNSLTNYNRRKTREVMIGNVPMGGDNPIRVQSMTTIDTMDTQGSVDQVLRMVESGCEYVRITAPSIKEARNLQEIRNELHKRGCFVPLVADIHFTPNAAELAAKIVEKVRVNPGNYADKKKFEEIEYTDQAYADELVRIREKFSPLVEICKEHGTAMRIGTNHGSLSDRIMSRYGDTPLGMVESALEFIRICEDLGYFEIVVSMKSSNPQVMIQAYRLLVQKLDEEGLQPYPLHLGVTEAGEAEDGRIKSALGIGTLLEEGLGDTVRVSLTEEPEVEAPVAIVLVDRLEDKEYQELLEETSLVNFNPFEFVKRVTHEVLNFGNDNVPRVIANLSSYGTIGVSNLKSVGHFYLSAMDKWTMNDLGVDYIYSGSNPTSFMLPNGLREILDFDCWNQLENRKNKYPIVTLDHATLINSEEAIFVLLDEQSIHEENVAQLASLKNAVFILVASSANAFLHLRLAINRLVKFGITNPVTIFRHYADLNADAKMMFPATDVGGLLVDGYSDGIMLSYDPEEGEDVVKLANETSFGILQAARARITKAEYISCPSCGRTLFDLQETTAMIRKRTDHLKGIKIGIMGCIVNGPGEMADADYGYVGSGKGKITLYKGKEVIKRGVPSENALDELIELIKKGGNWIEAKEVIGS